MSSKKTLPDTRTQTHTPFNGLSTQLGFCTITYLMQTFAFFLQTQLCVTSRSSPCSHNGQPIGSLKAGHIPYNNQSNDISTNQTNTRLFFPLS